jgi:ketosteroid isomerase-like protein
MTNQQLIEHFYSSFAKGDIEAMVTCYAPTCTFEDPAFGKLTNEQVGNMWRMLHQSSKGQLKVVFSNVHEIDANTVKANWQANYVFSQTGRSVENKISATFIIKEGKIINHIDSFNLWSWSKQALGTTGHLIGWTGFFKKGLQKKTGSLLKKFSGK